MKADKGASEDVDKVACEDVDKEGLAVARGASATSRSETSGASSTTSAVFHSPSALPPPAPPLLGIGRAWARGCGRPRGAWEVVLGLAFDHALNPEVRCRCGVSGQNQKPE